MTLQPTPSGADRREMGPAELSAQLWELRRLMEEMELRLQEQGLLAQAGLHRLLPRATEEVGDLMRRLEEAEAVRAGMFEQLAADLGVAAPAKLSALAAAAPEPWGDVLCAHGAALLQAAEQLDRSARDARGRMAASLSSVQDAMALLGKAPPDYGPSGVPARPGYPRGGGASVYRLVDEAV